MRFTGIKTSGNNKRRGINVFIIKAAGLRRLVAFFTTYPMFFNDEADIADDILLADL